METTFLAMPCYGGTIWNQTMLTVMCAQGEAKDSRKISLCMPDSSLLCQGFNLAWVEALNQRDKVENLKWFVMLHSDIQLQSRIG